MVRRAEWSVSTMYSWPSPIAVRAIASIVAPPSLHVECRWQSPRSASRYALRPPSVIGTCVSASSLVEVRGRLAVSASRDHPRRRVADARRARSACRRAARSAELLGGVVADDVERPDEGLGLEPAVVRPVEAVHHAFERLHRCHTRAYASAPRWASRPYGQCALGSLPYAPSWNASAWSASPTPARARCTTPSRAAARSPRRTRSPPRTPTSASPGCPTSGSTGWPRCRKSKNVVHAAVQVVDIGGLVEGASKGEGLGNKFLANIREVDAIVFVLRAFEDDDVTGPSDPIEHLRVVEIELALADLETVEKRLNAGRAPVEARQDASATSSTPSRVAYAVALRRPPALPRRPEGRPARAARPVLPAHQPAGARRRQRRRGRARRDPRGRGQGRRRVRATPATTSR